jgi:hypothetical protein
MVQTVVAAGVVVKDNPAYLLIRYDICYRLIVAA